LANVLQRLLVFAGKWLKYWACDPDADKRKTSADIVKPDTTAWAGLSSVHIRSWSVVGGRLSGIAGSAEVGA